MVKLLAGHESLPAQVFIYWVYDSLNHLPTSEPKLQKILVVATDIWDLSSNEDTAWMNDSRFPTNRCCIPSIDLLDDENIWEFPATAEGEMAAHKKMCEIYAAELERIHKS